MLTPFLAYFIKVNIALGLFFAFYRLFFGGDTFFQWRRFLLLAFYLLAFLYPLCDMQEWLKEQSPMAEVIQIYSTALLPEVIVTAAAPSGWATVGWKAGCLLYTGIAGLLIIRFFFQLSGIGRLWRKARPATLYGHRVRLLDRPAGPFSFFRLIFLHPASYADRQTREILVHEQTHADEWHSVDVLLSEWICILCWFNPFAWLLKREVRHNLEYLADNRVLEAGYDSKSYQYLLLGLSRPPQAIAGLYTNFHVLHLKNRIRMMNKKRSRGIGRTKYLLFLPLGAILMFFNNIEAVARITRDLTEMTMGTQTPVRVKATVVDQAQKPLPGVNVTVKEGSAGTLTASDGTFELEAPEGGTLLLSSPGLNAREIEVKAIRENLKIQLLPQSHFSEGKYYTVVEKMPRFPGGDAELLQFLAHNIRYPKEAEEKQLGGRVICSFIVGKEGEIYDVKVIRSVHPLLDAEAIRVLNTMPRWTPGENEGKPVAVEYTVPISFSQSAGGRPEDKRIVALDNEHFTGEDPANPVYRVAEHMPQYPGGDEALLAFIAHHIKYPEDARKTGKQGRVICLFIVEKDGQVSNVKVLRSLYPSLDEEAVRVIKSFPRWTPGKVKGNPVRVTFTVPITFRLA